MSTSLSLSILFLSYYPLANAAAHNNEITLRTLPKQTNSWYNSIEAKKIANTFLFYQNTDGGWPRLSNENLLEPTQSKAPSTIDNQTTFTQIEFLAKVYQKQADTRYRYAITHGIEYIIDHQSEDGEWPPFTIDNNDSMTQFVVNNNVQTNILTLLKQISMKEGIYSFVNQELAQKAKCSYQKGIQFILSSQVIQNGIKTAWSAQYYENMPEPTTGAHNFTAITTRKSVDMIRILMGIEHPEQQVIDAIESAIVWFDKVKVMDKKMITINDLSLPNGQSHQIVDQKGHRIWASFYTLADNKPIFLNRNNIPVYRLEDIQIEQRTHYSWCTETPELLLTKDYPAWQARWRPENNVLK